MRILKYLIFLLLITAIGVAIYVAIQPDNYKVSTNATIQAPQPVIYNYINDLKEWQKWSPWHEKDKNASVSFGEVSKGQDASYSWNGETMGEGTIKTNYSKKDSINQTINFITPYESTSKIFWTLSPVEKQKETVVTWGMEGKLSFTEKAMILLKGDMEADLTKDFNRGLKKLDSLIISDMKKYSISIIGETAYGGGYYLYQTASAKQNEIDIATKRIFPEIKSFMEDSYVTAAGNEFILFQQMNDNNETAIFSASIPIKERIGTPPGSTILCGFIEPGNYFKTVLKGDYSNINETWIKAREAMKQQDLEPDPTKYPFETHIRTSKEYPNPADHLTEVYIPILSSVNTSSVINTDQY